MSTFGGFFESGNRDSEAKEAANLCVQEAIDVAGICAVAKSAVVMAYQEHERSGFYLFLHKSYRILQILLEVINLNFP